MAEPTYTPPVLDLLGAEHVRRYQETQGRVGYLWNGVSTLLLTTIGRRSGRPRTLPLIFTRYGPDYVVIASKGGAPQHPHWYLNLLAEPLADVQVAADQIPTRARTAEGAEREEMWAAAVALWPNYETYQTRTDRLIPVVALRPI